MCKNVYVDLPRFFFLTGAQEAALEAAVEAVVPAAEGVEGAEGAEGEGGKGMEGKFRTFPSKKNTFGSDGPTCLGIASLGPKILSGKKTF